MARVIHWGNRDDRVSKRRVRFYPNGPEGGSYLSKEWFCNHCLGELGVFTEVQDFHEQCPHCKRRFYTSDSPYRSIFDRDQKEGR